MLPRNVTFSVLANPPQRNKQEELQCSYGVLRWQAAIKEVNTGEAMVPVVDFWRVFVDGKYWGKTRSLSFCLKKSEKREGEVMSRSGSQAEEVRDRHSACDDLRVFGAV